MRTLEEILQEYFDCEKPFIGVQNTPNDADCVGDCFTKEGSEAYDRLIQLVYDIHKLTGIDSEEMVKGLDAIASGAY